ncbi:MAG: DsrE family protein [Verrucomicrobiae bacterium]|nr:DsrE family protein [Verrucomicrobiae bacterium]
MLKSGILLATPPDAPVSAAAVKLARDHLSAGNNVFLYLIDEGVRNLDTPPMAGLRAAGIKLFACAYGAQNRGIAWNPDLAAFSGLTVLADILGACDTFQAFTPLGQSPVPPPRISGQLPKTLVIVSEDPMQSRLPAEAIRIAAGISAWKKTEVTLLLRGPSFLILSSDTDDFVDADHYPHYLPIIRDWPAPVLLAPEALPPPPDPTLKHRQITAKEEADLRANSHCLIPF